MCNSIPCTADEKNRRIPKGEAQTKMKKLMTLMLGLSLTFGAVATVFAQDTPKKEDTKGSKKKGGKKKEETPKKDGGSR
jgi:hypothetical protein